MDFRWVIGFFKNRKRLAWFCVDGFLSSPPVKCGGRLQRPISSLMEHGQLKLRQHTTTMKVFHFLIWETFLPSSSGFGSLELFSFSLSIFLAFIPAICKSSAFVNRKKKLMECHKTAFVFPFALSPFYCRRVVSKRCRELLRRGCCVARKSQSAAVVYQKSEREWKGGFPHCRDFQFVAPELQLSI